MSNELKDFMKDSWPIWLLISIVLTGGVVLLAFVFTWERFWIFVGSIFIGLIFGLIGSKR